MQWQRHGNAILWEESTNVHNGGYEDQHNGNLHERTNNRVSQVSTKYNDKIFMHHTRAF